MKANFRIVCTARQEDNLAHHKSAIKRVRTNEERRLRNKANRTRVRNEIKNFRALLAGGDTDEAQRRFPGVVSRIQQSATKGVFHKRCAARRVARLARALNRASAQ